MNQTIGTPEQDREMQAALDELKNVPGPVMQAMQRAQSIYGYLPIEVQSRIASAFGIPLEEVYGIATFYTQFVLKPKGKYTVGVCLGTACYVKGAGDILERFKEALKLNPGETAKDMRFTLDATRCIGCCGLAPVITVNDEVYGSLKKEDVETILKKYYD
ncbi:MAG: NAD(P)H-dependent oxidoreductase subunit E [Clostridiales bacterium]|jgi:NADP-reducing hydrogenase subunit HndA|nr:NAD(P)H-dependent oxidoreductase subunit E [Clostridiales bacterium]